MDVAETIATARLRLRPVERKDGAQLLRLIDNWNVARWLGAVPWPYRADDMSEFIEKIALPARAQELRHICTRLTWARYQAPKR